MVFRSVNQLTAVLSVTSFPSGMISSSRYTRTLSLCFSHTIPSVTAVNCYVKVAHFYIFSVLSVLAVFGLNATIIILA